jgi:N-methylhydantoinase B/oxoprolinase/acetone carboxylase alpha subunit
MTTKAKKPTAMQTVEQPEPCLFSSLVEYDVRNQYTHPDSDLGEMLADYESAVENVQDLIEDFGEDMPVVEIRRLADEADERERKQVAAWRKKQAKAKKPRAAPTRKALSSTQLVKMINDGQTEVEYRAALEARKAKKAKKAAV